jgi:hypothetical protein
MAVYPKSQRRVGLVLLSSAPCPRWPFRVFLDGIEKVDLTRRHRASRHVNCLAQSLDIYSPSTVKIGEY